MEASSIAWWPPRSARLECFSKTEGHSHQIHYRDRIKVDQGKPFGLDGASTHFVNRVACGCHQVDGLYHLDRRARVSSLLRSERVGVDPE